jgi:hypothetical protein
MKINYWVIVILFILSSKSYAQEVRVNNSFIILVNNKLTTAVAGVRLILSDTTGKEESINGGYYPGVLYVSNIETKSVLYADSVRKLTLVFDNYEYPGNKQVINNYKIGIDRKWFKESLIILRIFDINKTRGTYKYSFEVPGHSFGQKLKQ